MVKKIKQADIGKLLERWAKDYRIFVPSRDGEITRFDRWDGKDTGFLSIYRNTVVPAKSVFFPVKEEMFSYKKDSTGYQLKVPGPSMSKKLLFGIRPCDASALAMLDVAFKEGYEDPYYLEKRRDTVLVGMTCLRPYDSCFCTSLGGGPGESKNVDIMMTQVGDEYILEGITQKGEELLAGVEYFTDASEADISRLRSVKEGALKQITRKVNVKDITQRIYDVIENKEFWETSAIKCVSCGVCTFFCPTCYCFDISDEKEKGTGIRKRAWDSCQFPVYTKMPAENPREEKWRRVRQKVAHKYAYFPTLYGGTISCTGCGRCIRLCPVSWDITAVINSVPEKVTTESK